MNLPGTTEPQQKDQDPQASSGAPGEPPVVSCIMIFLDAVRFLDEAIQSVRDQTVTVRWELILVDDGSSDGSTEIAKAWAASDARIRYLDHPGHENRGMSASRNVGLAVALGEFVAFLDSDDVWLPEMLQRRLGLLEHFHDADVAIGPVWAWYGWSGTIEDRLRDRLLTFADDLDRFRTHRPPALFNAVYGRSNVNGPVMMGFVARRTALDRVGGFDAQFRGLFEDQVIYAKMGLELAVVLDDRPLGLYRQHKASAVAARRRAGNASQSVREVTQRYTAWLDQYVSRVESSNDELAPVVVDRTKFQPSPPPRRIVRRAASWLAPSGVSRSVEARRTRQRLGTMRARGDAVDVTPAVRLDRWSDQFISSWRHLMTGRVVVVTPHQRAIQPSAMPTGVEVVTIDAATETLADRTHDWLVLPIATTRGTSPSTVSRILTELGGQRGTIAAIVGPALTTESANSPIAVEHLAADLAHGSMRHVRIEQFGIRLPSQRGEITAPFLTACELDQHDRRICEMFGLLVIERAGGRK